MWSRFGLAAVSVASVLVSSTFAHADTTVLDDFEDVSDWSGLSPESVRVMEGAGSGSWADTVAIASISKSFDPPLDLSGRSHLGMWLYSAVANGAELQLVLDSDRAATEGPDYYSTEITVDWQGWRWLWLPRARLEASRQPLGWQAISAVSLHASGWGHEPRTDTALILDQMVMASAVLDEVTVTQGWVGSDFVANLSLSLVEPDGASLGVDISCEAADLGVEVSPTHIVLAPSEHASAEVRLTIPPAVWSEGPYLSHLVSIEVLSDGGAREGWQTELANPGPEMPAPRTLLTSEDFERIAEWSGRQPWVADRVAGIVARATGWRDDFVAKYGLAEVALPPEGGQWGMHYVCPDHGANLVYEPPMTHRCPIDGQVWSGWPYDQVIYGRQHNDLAHAAKANGLAYQFTGDSARAADAAEILLDYARRYATYPIHGKDGTESGSGARVLAQTLDESGWLIEMAWAYDLISATDALSTAEQGEVEQALLRASAAVIARYDAGLSNWQAWHNAAIATVGRAIDDPSLVAFALTGRSGFERHMADSVLDDGFWYEGSWGYHFFTLTPMTLLAELGARGAFPLFADDRLRSMYTAPVLFAPPDLVLPAFNDASSVNLRGSAQWRLEAAYKAYGDPLLLLPLVGEPRTDESAFWGPETLPSEASPLTESSVFDASGFAVMRGGTTGDPWYLALDYGPHGGWHGHFDKLGFVFFARGQLMGLDPGSHSYALPVHDSWDRATLAHNTVVVDERSQEASTGRLEAFASLPSLVLARANAGPATPAVELTRELVMVGGDYVLDRMEARSTDGAAHDYDWIYHNPGALTDTLDGSAEPDFPDGEGYQHLTGNRAQTSASDGHFDFGFASDTEVPGAVWTNDEAIEASSRLSDEDAHGGQWSNLLTYDFSAAPDGYITYRVRSFEAVPEVPTAVSVWVRGDRSMNGVRLRLVDATGESHVSPTTVLDFEDWRELAFEVSDAWSHWSGNDDGRIDLPLSALVVEVSHESEGADIGRLFADDWTLTLPGTGAQLAEDFEVVVARESLWIAGEDGTTYVAGEGIGPDLQIPVPYVMVRRSGVAVDFDVLHEPHGAEPAFAATFEALAETGGDHQGYRIASATFDDLLLLSVSGEDEAYGDVRSDAKLAWMRRGGGGLKALVLVASSRLEVADSPIFVADAPVESVEFNLDEGVVEIVALDGDLDGARLLAPGTSSVVSGDAAVPFSLEGDVVVFGEVPPPIDDVGPGLDAGDAAFADVAVMDCGTGDSSSTEDVAGLIDASVEADAPLPETGAVGPTAVEGRSCGCLVTGAPHTRTPPLALLVLALLILRRRRPTERSHE